MYLGAYLGGGTGTSEEEEDPGPDPIMSPVVYPDPAFRDHRALALSRIPEQFKGE